MRIPERIEFYRHQLGDDEKARILAALDDPILTTGNAVAEAEAALAEHLGVRNVVCVDSCTAALHLALIANGIGPGDEVIVPAMTFVATANAVLMAGAKPVFADVDRETYNITVATIAPHVTARTRAIVPVHLYGLLCDMETLAEFAASKGVVLVEDAAHCIEACRMPGGGRHGGTEGRRDGGGEGDRERGSKGARIEGRNSDEGAANGDTSARSQSKVQNQKSRIASPAAPLIRPGSHSAAACFSFYATKNITCGEGGALATNDDELAERVRRLSLHGMTTSAADRYRKRYKHWDMPQWGWKYNLDNIRGSLLLPQIAKLDERWRRRIEIAESYEAALGGEGVEMQNVEQPNWSARHLFTVLSPAGRRDEFVHRLQGRGIGVAVNYRAVHLLEFYAREFGHQRGEFPVAEEIGDRTISLPLYPSLTEEQIDRVIRAVRNAVVGVAGGAALCGVAEVCQNHIL